MHYQLQASTHYAAILNFGIIFYHMNQSRLIQIDEIGPVLFEPSKKARRIIIFIRPFKGIRVAVPQHASFQKAQEFVLARKNWIQKNIEKMKLYENALSANPIVATPVDKQAASAILTRRLNELASKHGFSYKRLTVRNQKTRWGSCSHDNNISLNMQLVRLPQELIDYVILHELVHTRVKNHSPAFWDELDKLVVNSRKLRGEIKNYLPAAPSGSS